MNRNSSNSPRASPAEQNSPRESSSSAQSTGNFACNVCGRTYKARETLNRHSNIHTTQFRHVCSDCGISFYRKDLLVRHRKLHEPRDMTLGHADGRQRSQRACDRCRKRKMKCNSRLPCTGCFKSGQHCTYTKKSDRLSQRDRPPVQTQRGRESEVESGRSVTESDADDAPSEGYEFIDDMSRQVGGQTERTMSQASSTNVSTRAVDPIAPHGEQIVGAASFAEDLGNVIQMEDPQVAAFVESSWPSGEASQSVTWPWLYEDMFLQGTPNVDDLGLTNLSSQGYHNDGMLEPLAMPQMSRSTPSQFTQENEDPGMDSFMASWQDPSLIQRQSSSGGPGRRVPVSQTRHLSANQGVPVPSHNLLPSNGAAENGLNARGSAVEGRSTLGMGTRTAPSSQQETVVRKLNEYAFHGLSGTTPDNVCSPPQFWQGMSPAIEHVFGLSESSIMTDPVESNPETPTHVLHRFVHLYFKHFHPLWTLIWQQDLNYDNLPPHLYLTLSSIGAMYAGKGPTLYGSMTHEKLRALFMTTPLWDQDSDELSESICQSILLTQVSALYFGQKKAFSCAQQLGTILISQARKINLFYDCLANTPYPDGQSRSSAEQQNLLDRGIRAETRRRLAFGIYRADIFLSILLNTRPLLSYEELNMEMPCAASLWTNNTQDLERYLLDTEINRKNKRRLLFSDLVRIAMDRSEPLPSLNPAESELLIFALQQSVWRWSHDRALFERMTGATIANATSCQHRDAFFENEPPSPPTSRESRPTMPTGSTGHDHLDYSIRQMADLKNDYARTISALRKWRFFFSTTSSSAQLATDRSVLVSNLLLYHLSFIRLKADVESLHLISYTPTDSQKRDTVVAVHDWSKTESASDALSHACAVWSLVSKEISRDEKDRAKFSILAFIALHHAAAVVWAYAGTHPSPGKASLDASDSFEGEPDDLRIYRDNSRSLLTSFTELLQKVSPSWVAMSGFSATTRSMAGRAFPTID